MSRLIRRSGSPLTASHDGLGRNLPEWLLSGACQDLQEDILALTPGGAGETRPYGSLTIARDQPRQRARNWAASGPWARRGADGRLILSVKFRRAKFCPNTHARSFVDAHVPDGLTVSGDLPVQTGWARTWHGGDHRTMSLGSSSTIFSSVDGLMRMMILEWSPTRTSTSAAPACFAARIARATSACVRAAGRRLMSATENRTYGGWPARASRTRDEARRCGQARPPH